MHYGHIRSVWKHSQRDTEILSFPPNQLPSLIVSLWIHSLHVFTSSWLLADCLARLLTFISLVISNSTLTLLVFSMIEPRETDMLSFLSHQPVSLLTELLAVFCHDTLMKSTSHVIRGHRISPACLEKDRLHCDLILLLMCHEVQLYLMTSWKSFSCSALQTRIVNVYDESQKWIEDLSMIWRSIVNFMERWQLLLQCIWHLSQEFC